MNVKLVVYNATNYPHNHLLKVTLYPLIEVIGANIHHIYPNQDRNA